MNIPNCSGALFAIRGETSSCNKDGVGQLSAFSTEGFSRESSPPQPYLDLV
jgi:hypothetical protein